MKIIVTGKNGEKMEIKTEHLADAFYFVINYKNVELK